MRSVAALPNPDDEDVAVGRQFDPMDGERDLSIGAVPDDVDQLAFEAVRVGRFKPRDRVGRSLVLCDPDDEVTALRVGASRRVLG